MKKLFATLFLTIVMSPVWATTWMIGDDDGYGIGIPDNTDHTFDGFNAGHDGRSAGEVASTNGAQYTDTYSTTHGQYSPTDQVGDVATFIFTGLGNGWTEGSMWFDMADFQATTFGAVNTTYNGIAQNWSFNDGFPTTVVRFFDLQQDVIDSINLLGSLTVSIDRNASADFYGFDYALLSSEFGNVVPEPGSLAIIAVGLGLLGFASNRRRKS